MLSHETNILQAHNSSDFSEYFQITINCIVGNSPAFGFYFILCLGPCGSYSVSLLEMFEHVWLYSLIHEGSAVIQDCVSLRHERFVLMSQAAPDAGRM